MNPWQDLVRRCTMMVVASACVVAVLLALADDPSADEFYKGIPAALAAYWAVKATNRPLKDWQFARARKRADDDAAD